MRLIIFVLALLPLTAFAQGTNIMDYRQQDTNEYVATEPEKNSNPNSIKPDQPPDNIQIKNLNASDTVAVENKLCIKGDCRNKWPVLKCAEFSGRPAGESGESFCQGVNKTCFSVFVGSGASFYNECSVAPLAVHKTRCCWVE